MNLGKMLRMLREDILHDRSDQVSGASDKLWSDTTLIDYLDEAQRRFARKSVCIRDGSSSFCTIKTVTGQKEYPLDPSIFGVVSAKFEGNGTWDYTQDPAVYSGTVYPDHADLARAGHFQLDGYTVPDRYFLNPLELSRLNPGKPMAFATDEYTSAGPKGSRGVMNLRLYPIITPQFSGSSVYLRVVRMPTVRFTSENLDVESEVPEEYHMYLLEYAAYLALRIVDHELGDPERAADFEAQFEKHMDEARRENLRKLFQPNVWSFGRNAFSYTSN